MTNIPQIEYSIVTGRFYRGGKRVGCHATNGYITLWLAGKQWLGHRLAYHLLGADLPPQVDHANGVRDCNAWHNLRDACNRTNQEARHKAVGVSGVIGVYLRRDTGKFTSKIKHLGKSHHLGDFHTLAEAQDAYLQAKHRLHSLHPRQN